MQDAPGGFLEERADVQSTQRSLKIVRKLCRQTGVPDDVQKGIGARAGPAGRFKRRSISAADTSSSDSDTGATVSDAGRATHPVDIDQEDITKWAEVKELLNKLHTDERLAVIKDISSALTASSQKAIRDLDILDQLEGNGSPSTSWRASFQDDDPLLELVPEETSGGLAALRVHDLLPRLQEAMRRRHDEQKEMEKARRMGSVDHWELESCMSGSALEEEEDVEMDEVNLANEVEEQLNSYGEMPARACHDLHVTMEAQRNEIWRLVHAIKQEETQLHVARVALDCLEGKNPRPGDPGHRLIRTAARQAREIKTGLVNEKLREAAEKVKADRLSMNLPTEEEVQKVMRQGQQMKEQAERQREVLAKLREESLAGWAALHHRSSKSQQAPGDALDSSARAALEAATDAAPDKLRHVKEELQESAAQLREQERRLAEELQESAAQLREQERRLAEAESCLSGAATSLRVLDKARLLFLQCLRVGDPSSAGGKSIAAAVNVALEDQEDEHCDEFGEERLNSLRSEESWLRIGLLEMEDHDDEDEGAGATASDAHARIAAAMAIQNIYRRRKVANQQKQVEALVVKLQKLWRRKLKTRKASQASQPTVARQPSRLSTVAASGSAHRFSSKGPFGENMQSDSLGYSVWKLVHHIQHEACKEALPEGESAVAADLSPLSLEAILRLRDSPQCEVLRRLLDIRTENMQLRRELKHAQRELEELRRMHGMPKLLEKGESSVLVASAEQLSELRQKVLALQALRNKWWRERQDPHATARRSLAELGLPDDVVEPDRPPASVLADSFTTRIQLSATAL